MNPLWNLNYIYGVNRMLYTMYTCFLKFSVFYENIQTFFPLVICETIFTNSWNFNLKSVSSQLISCKLYKSFRKSFLKNNQSWLHLILVRSIENPFPTEKCSLKIINKIKRLKGDKLAFDFCFMSWYLKSEWFNYQISTIFSPLKYV